MQTSKISIRSGRPAADREAILQVLSENLPEAADPARFDWAYLGNPDGPALVWLAETTGGDVIGTSAAFPRIFRVNGVAVRVLVYSDFAIDSRYRSLGPALALLRATLSPVDRKEFEFALDYPSESMLAVYRRIGGRELGRQSRYVRLLRASGVARRRWGDGAKSTVLGALGDFTIRSFDSTQRIPRGHKAALWSMGFTEELSCLARKLGDRFSIVGERSAAYLEWRYKPAIRFPYHVVALHFGQKLLGYGVLQGGGDGAMTIVEFICGDNLKVERALMLGITRIARLRGAESLQASCIEGSAWAAILERQRFSAREQSAGPVVYFGESGVKEDWLDDIEQWWMTDGDRDG